VRALAHHVTSREGGFGAVRELADLILAAQGHTDQTRLAQLPQPALTRTPV
jgi:3-deoxy-D-manno-octulosonate 8-phosphate phosphatase KdsC-like HAD superfamily phosphatase